MDATLSACLYRSTDIGYRYKVNAITILEQMRCPQRTMRFSQKRTAFVRRTALGY